MVGNGQKKYSTKKIGNMGEDIAESYLLKKGYEILDRNYYSRYGEIDIIGKLEDQIIFFEVKTRTNEAFGNPEDSIDQKKIDCMISTAFCFLEEHTEEELDWQMDLLAIKLFPDGKNEILHFEDINE
jgi:putative endonuclease